MPIPEELEIKNNEVTNIFRNYLKKYKIEEQGQYSFLL